jgi:alkylhydroperoxidase/carboxymuconolactone decarboxylase family protein YurZ
MMTVFEQACRAGFAIGQIEEAMGLLADMEKNDARYWAMKALTRARDALKTGKCS